jgi:prevent-host-death family protein
MKLGLREANQQFSRAIRAVRAGKEVVLTERGRPIAVIKPLERDEGEDVPLRTMAEDGLIIPAKRKGPMPAAGGRPARVKGKPISDTVIDDREDRA